VLRHRSKHAKRRGVHHQVGELEHRFERLSAKTSIGRRFTSGTKMSPIAKSTLKHNNCSTWPSATDFAMFSGKISVMSCVAVCGETFRVCAAEPQASERLRRRG